MLILRTVGPWPPTAHSFVPFDAPAFGGFDGKDIVGPPFPCFEVHAAQGYPRLVDRMGNRATVSNKFTRQRENEKIV